MPTRRSADETTAGAATDPQGALTTQPAHEHRRVGHRVGVVEEPAEPSVVRRGVLVEHLADRGLLGAGEPPPAGLEVEGPAGGLVEDAPRPPPPDRGPQRPPPPPRP